MGVLYTHGPRFVVIRLWAGPPACDVNPFCQAAAFLAFDIDNVGIAAAAASNAVLLWWIPVLPVVILLEPLSLVRCRLLEERLSGKLPPKRRVGRAVLDGGVSVPEITEVVDISWRQKCTGSEGVDGRITPLEYS